MIFNKFNLSIIFQVILIGINTSIIVWTLSQPFMLITRYSLIVAWFLQIGILIFYINKIKRDLKKFLISLKYNDTSIVFDSGKNHPFSDLHQSFQEILEAFENIRIEKEAEYQFFQTAIEQINVGIIAFNSSGKIKLLNKASLRLLNLRSIVNISTLSTVLKSLPNTLNNLMPNQTRLITLKKKDEIIKLSLNASLLKIKGDNLKIVSIQNITQELEQGEMDAWQRLIKVITHEILNSVSPITLLSSGLLNQLDLVTQTNAQIDEKKLDETKNGLKVIHNRSKGLTTFIEDYRKAMQLPEPRFEKVQVFELLNDMLMLYKEEAAQKKIKLSYEIDEKIEVFADKKLIEQVLINLINNAIYFTCESKTKEISLMATSDDSQVCIKIKDSGSGIPPEVFDQIFIPFFSTKEKGSGIGLSLARQIMRLHNGNISVESVPEKGTTFTLHF